MDIAAMARRNLRQIRFDRKYLLGLVGVTLAYAVSAKLGLSLARTTQQVTAVWPPSGIALAVLLVFGYRYWPGVYVGAFVANLLTQEPAVVALGIAVGNTLEAVAGAALMQKVGGFRRAFERPRDAAVFTAGAVLSTTIAAFIGTACLAAGGLIVWAHYWPVMNTWWRGDLMGDLVFGSLLLVYLNRSVFVAVRGRLLEGGLMLATLFGASIFVFTAGSNGLSVYPYLLFPVMIWAAARFTQLGVATGSLVVAATAIWATVTGLGPFVQHGSFEANLFDVQLFVAVLISTSLILAMAISARLAAEKALGERARELKRLDDELEEANKRVTKILAGVLDKGPHRPPRTENEYRQ